MGSAGQDAAALERADLDAKVVALRVDGLTFREIAARLEISVGGAHKAFSRAIAGVPAPAVHELRDLEGERLDAVIGGMLPLARQGDADAAREVTRAVMGRARLFGLLAPTNVKVEPAGLGEFLATAFPGTSSEDGTE